MIVWPEFTVLCKGLESEAMPYFFTFRLKYIQHLKTETALGRPIHDMIFYPGILLLFGSGSGIMLKTELPSVGYFPDPTACWIKI